jgi:nucleoprotein TPR
LKAAESANASLEAQRVKSRSFMFTEEEFKSLQLQVEVSIFRN